MSVAIIINPVSGRARPDAARTRAAAATAAVERHGDHPEIFVTERVGHARELAAAAAKRGVRLVLAWGGDGTFNEVASALAFGPVPVGLIPAGSGNGLARELGISLRPEQAIAAALKARWRLIDAGELAGRLFFNIAGLGIDADIAARFNDPGNRRRGLSGYARMTASALVHYTPARYHITADRTLDARAVLVCIANSAQYGHNARIAPNARVDDGLLDIVVVEEQARLRTLRYLPHLFTGGVERVPGCTIMQVTRATIESDRAMTLHLDGETLAAGTTVTTRVHPGALRVAVGPDPSHR